MGLAVLGVLLSQLNRFGIYTTDTNGIKPSHALSKPHSAIYYLTDTNVYKPKNNRF